jgi:hypothetical protein
MGVSCNTELYKVLPHILPHLILKITGQAGVVTILILEMRNIKLREVKQFAQGHSEGQEAGQ